MTILCGRSLTIPATVGNPGKINRTVGVPAITQVVATGTVRVRLPAPDPGAWVVFPAPTVAIRYVRPPANGPPFRDVAQLQLRYADPHPTDPQVDRVFPRVPNPTHDIRR